MPSGLEKEEAKKRNDEKLQSLICEICKRYVPPEDEGNGMVEAGHRVHYACFIKERNHT